MEEYSNKASAYLTTDEKELILKVEQANKEAERAYWWMKGIDRKTADRLNVGDMVQTVLNLLQKIDNTTMDITIKINKK